MATEVGVAYVRILPSMRGFSGEVSKALNTGLTGAAERAGRDAGRALSTGIQGGFRTVTAGASRAGGQVESAFREASRGAREDIADIGHAGSFVPLVAASEAAAERMESSFEDSSRDSIRAIGRIGTSGAGLSLLATGFGAVGLAAAGAGAATVGFGLQQAAALEQTTIGFTALLGSAEEADSFIREMQSFAASTPFEFPGLANNARQLLAVSDAIGVTREEIIPTIGTIGDLTAVLGAPPEAMDAVIRAMGQMGSRGKITSEEMLQLAEALPGFQPFQAMADGLGLTTAELQEQISAGTVPAKEGIDALLQGMREFPGAAGAMAAQAQTLTGVFSTFKDTITLSLTEAFQPMVPTVTSALTGSIPAIQAALGAIAPALSGIAGTVLGVVVDVVRELGPAFGTALTGLSNGLAALGQAFGPALEPISGALQSLGPLFVAVGNAAAPLLNVFGTLLGTVIPPLSQVLTGLVNNLAPVIEVLGGAFLQVIEAMAPVFGALEDALTETFAVLSPVLTEIASIFSDVLVQAIQTLAPVLAEVIAALGGGLQEVLTTLAPVIKELAAALAERFLAVIGTLAPVLPELTDALVQIAVAVAELLAAVVPLLIPLLQLQTLLISKIGAPVLLAIAQAVAVLATGLATLITFVAGLIPSVSGVASGLSSLWTGVLVPLGSFLASVFMPVIRVLLALLVGPLVLGVASVIAIATLLWQHVLVPLGQFLGGVFSPVVSALGAVIGGYLSAQIAVARGAWNAFKAAVGFAKDVLSNIWHNFLSPIGNFLRNTFKPAIDAVKGAWDLFAGAIDGAIGVLGSLWDVAQDVKGVIEDVGNAISNLPGAGIVGGAMDAIGLRAKGGPVSAGQPYIVGEKRPELFIPHTSGTILPRVPSGTPTGGGSAMVGIGGDFLTLQQEAVARLGVLPLVAATLAQISGLTRIIKGEVDVSANALSGMARLMFRQWAPRGSRIFEDSSIRIPGLADGGIAHHRRGGVLARVAEAGEDEAISPLSDLEAMVASASLDAARLAALSTGPAAPTVVEFDLTNGTDELMRVVQKWLRTNNQKAGLR